MIFWIYKLFSEKLKCVSNTNYICITIKIYPIISGLFIVKTVPTSHSGPLSEFFLAKTALSITNAELFKLVFLNQVISWFKNKKFYKMFYWTKL